MVLIVDLGVVVVDVGKVVCVALIVGVTIVDGVGRIGVEIVVGVIEVVSVAT